MSADQGVAKRQKTIVEREEKERAEKDAEDLREKATLQASLMEQAVLRYRDQKKKILPPRSQRSEYLTQLHEKVKRPADSKTWQGEWTDVCIANNRILQSEGTWDNLPDRGEKDYCTLDAVKEKDNFDSLLTGRLKPDIDERVQYDFSQEDAEAFTLITNKRKPIARALRKGEQTFAASLYKVVDVLQKQLEKQQTNPSPAVANALVDVNGEKVAPPCYRHLHGKAGLVQTDERWADLEKFDSNLFRGITSSAVTEAWCKPECFTEGGYVHHTLTNKGLESFAVVDRTADHGIVLFRSSEDEDDLIRTGIVTNKDRVSFPPHTLFALVDIKEAGQWSVEGIPGVPPDLRPQQTLYIVSATYRKAIAGSHDSGDARHCVSTVTLDYGDRSAYINNMYDVTSMPLLTMEQEFGREKRWVDRYGEEHTLRGVYEYVTGKAQFVNSKNGKRDERHNDWTVDDFMNVINGHIEARRTADAECRIALPEEECELTRDEVIAVRLYSGPAFQPINEFLRQVGKLTGDYRQAIANSPSLTFSATVGHLSSAVRKLAAVAELPADGYVYRGLEGTLPKSFWREDESLMVVATDLAFMSTSRNRPTPLGFMKAGKENVLWKIKCSKPGAHGFRCGADIRLLSQFEGEGEILFPPW